MRIFTWVKGGFDIKSTKSIFNAQPTYRKSFGEKVDFKNRLNDTLKFASNHFKCLAKNLSVRV
jgi:hypothetical protein